MAVEIICKNCDNTFEVSPCRKDSAVFCSSKCQGKWQSNKLTGEDNPNWNRIEKTCKMCDEDFEIRPSEEDQQFCSRKCYEKYLSTKTKSKNHNWKGRKLKSCEFCGKEIKIRPSEYKRKRFCSRDCLDKWRSNNQCGKNHHQYKKRIILSCKQCDKEFKVKPCNVDSVFCSKDCQDKYKSENQYKENNPNWKGGYDHYYGENWSDMRQKVLKRDNGKCVVCKRGKDELDQEPDVHHIVPVRKFDNASEANHLDNLVTLCRSHHQRVERWGLKPDIR